jgi:hypothetical protein
LIQIILVGREQELSVFVNGANVVFDVLALNETTALLIMAMDDLVANGPEFMPFAPDGSDDVCGP